MSEGANSVAELMTRCETLFSDDKSAVTLSTVHKAKGLEADNVYILRPELMPHPMAKTPEAIAQESNIEYVAVTRTKNKLVFVT
jgi:superfamily I DNA/RNA helicase